MLNWKQDVAHVMLWFNLILITTINIFVELLSDNFKRWTTSSSQKRLDKSSINAYIE